MPEKAERGAGNQVKRLTAGLVDNRLTPGEQREQGKLMIETTQKLMDARDMIPSQFTTSKPISSAMYNSAWTSSNARSARKIPLHQSRNGKNIATTLRHVNSRELSREASRGECLATI